MNKNNDINIFITGCSTGIGLDALQTLHKLGYHVIGSCRKAKDVDKLKQQGLNCIQLDLACSDSIKNAIKELKKHTHNKIDVLFNNGAFGLPGAVEDLSREAMQFQFNTNVFGTQELTNLIVPIMRENGGGKIVYNSSILGFAAMQYRGAYNASKFALEGFADTLRLEVKQDNIHISIIQPGPIISNFRANAFIQFKHWIRDNSSHSQNYKAMIARLDTLESKAPFVLKAGAVTRALLHIIKHQKPKIRYPITLPTKVFTWLKRLLPTRLLDILLIKAGGDGKR
jgi:short-subunit dehydrogenase